MKKVVQIMCCAVGSGMIGYFANRLDTGMGAACFALGVVILAGSIVTICKVDKSDK